MLGKAENLHPRTPDWRWQVSGHVNYFPRDGRKLLLREDTHQHKKNIISISYIYYIAHLNERDRNLMAGVSTSSFLGKKRLMAWISHKSCVGVWLSLDFLSSSKFMLIAVCENGEESWWVFWMMFLDWSEQAKQILITTKNELFSITFCVMSGWWAWKNCHIKTKIIPTQNTFISKKIIVQAYVSLLNSKLSPLGKLIESLAALWHYANQQGEWKPNFAGIKN